MRLFKNISRLFTAFAVVTLTTTQVALADEPIVESGDDGITVEAQPLASALQEFSDQSGLQIAYVATLAEDVSSKGTHDADSVAAALSEILDSTGLEYKFINDDTVAIGLAASPENEAEDPGNSRSASNPVLMVQNQTSATQEQTNRMEPATNRDKDNPVTIEEIIITGTNIRGAAPASPLHVINRAEIELSGVTTVGELLEQLPSNFGGGFNEDGGVVSGFTNARFTGESTVNLRGLGASASLVLFNGRRLAPAGNESLVDVSMIPVNAIERVEVLTDGASAIYGSDAIAGVVNFVMRRDFEGAETRLRFGTVTEGDLREYRAVQTFGKNWDNSNLFVSYQYHNRGDLEAVDRKFTAVAARSGAPNRNEIDILMKQESHNLLMSGTHAFSDRLSAQGDFLFSSRESNSDGEFRLDPTAQAGKTDQYAATLATFFEVTDSWELETAAVFGTTKLNFQITGPDNISFGGGSAENELWSIDSKLTGTLFDLPAGSIGVALGGQYREESLAGRQSGTDTRADRQLWSLYAETLIPIVGDANDVRGGQQLDLSLAVRHEDYSDFGSTTNPKAGVVWSPIDSLILRGTWGTSFRAPSLRQLDLDPTRRGAFYFDFPDPSMADGLTTALFELSFANDQLSPETSTAYTVGFDYQPKSIEGFSLSVTYFDVNFEDRISQPTLSLLTAFINRDVFASVILDNPTVSQVNDFLAPILLGLGINNLSGRPFDPADVEAIFDDRIQNLAATDVNGVDFSASYNFASELGDIGILLNGNYMFEFVDQVTPDSPDDDVLSTYLHPVDLRLRAGTTWSKDGLTVATFANYTDSYKNNVFVPPIKINSWTTVDLNISYDTGDRLGTWHDNTVVSFNVRNLLDQDPPFTGDGLALLGSGLGTPVNYDPANASPLGRFVSFELRKKF